MAKRNDQSRKPNNVATRKPVSTAAPAPVSTAVRNSPVPRNVTPAPAARQITSEMIAVRAYEIWQRGHGGSQQDHWYQAERELRGR